MDITTITPPSPRDLPLFDVSGVPPAAVHIVIQDAARMLEKALAYSEGEYLPEDILRLCAEGKMQLWAAADGPTLKGIAVTEISQYPRNTVCTLRVVAGEEFHRWKWGLKLIEQWAMVQGASSIRFYGREGWVREMRGDGYHKAYTVCSKELRCDDENIH